MGALLVSVSATVAVGALHTYSEARRIAATANATRFLFDAFQALRVERGLMLVVLGSEAPVDSRTETLVSAQRSAGEASLTEAMQRMHQLALAGLEERLQTLQTRHAAFAAMRPALEAAMHQPKAARDPKLAGPLWQVTEAMNDTMTDINAELVHSIQRLDATVDQLLAMKQAAWQVRLSASNLALRNQTALAAGRTWTRAELEMNQRDIGQVTFAWSIVSDVASRPDSPPLLAAAYRRALPWLSGPEAEETARAMDVVTEGRPASSIAPDFRDRQVGGLNLMANVANAAMADAINHADAQEHQALIRVEASVLVLLLSLALFVVGMLKVQGRVSTPLLRLAEAMHRLANGAMDTVIPPSSANDEIGRMTAAVQVFKDNMIAARMLKDAEEKGRAAKDFRQGAMDRHTRDFGTAASGVMAGLVRSAEQMTRMAQDMADMTHSSRETTARTAAGAVECANSLAGVAASAEMMAATITDLSRNVERSTQAVSQAVTRAEETDAKVVDMAEAAGRVSKILQVISSIAAQTNLLALNATIEAARAGEAGRGFAVVAGEVKALAAQTARATKEIGHEIESITHATQEAVNAVRAVVTTIGEVATVAISINDAIEAQGVSIREIAGSVTQIAATTGESSQAMESVSELSEKAEAASREVLVSAAQVGEVSGVLRSELDHFLLAVERAGEANRRAYERIAGNGTVARLSRSGEPPREAEIIDISMGGLALRADLNASPGTEMSVLLPGCTEPVMARVVSQVPGRLSLLLNQNPSMLPILDVALTYIATQHARAA
jgi:methyl-accepting chemotaxis protein